MSTAAVPPENRSRPVLFGVVANLALAVLLAIAAGLIVAWLWPDAVVPGDERFAGRVALLFFYARVFQFHLGLVALGLTFVILVLGRGWKRRLVAAAATAFILMPYAREYAPKRPPPAVSRALRVMSINLYAYNYDAPKILAAIEREDPDVLVACEVTDFTEANVFAPLARKYPRSLHPNYDNGAFVMSRVPFMNERSRTGDARRPLIFTVDGREFAMYPVHLTSPGNRSHLMRNREQTDVLASIVASERRPLVIVGDCNFTQMTGEYARLRDAGLRSTHDLIGFGLGNTWGPRWRPRLYRFPGVRIDQMLLSRELTVTGHHVGVDAGSDHQPIVADVAFAR